MVLWHFKNAINDDDDDDDDADDDDGSSLHRTSMTNITPTGFQGLLAGSTEGQLESKTIQQFDCFSRSIRCSKVEHFD